MKTAKSNKFLTVYQDKSIGHDQAVFTIHRDYIACISRRDGSDETNLYLDTPIASQWLEKHCISFKRPSYEDVLAWLNS
jgi:hypothetical protein